MARVLLLDPDPAHATCLKIALRAVTADTMVCENLEAVSRLLEDRTDVLILVSEVGENWKTEANRLRQLADRTAGSARIICLLRGPYRGPAHRVWGSCRGLKVLYEGN